MAAISCAVEGERLQRLGVVKYHVMCPDDFFQAPGDLGGDLLVRHGNRVLSSGNVWCFPKNAVKPCLLEQ
jgi:hypothetical protein